MRQITIRLAAALAALAATPALASGGLWCTVDDQNLKLDVSSGVTHGMGGAFFNFSSTAELRFPGAPGHFRSLDLGEKLVHHWIADGETRLLFYTETGDDRPHGYVQIVVRTGEGDEEDEDATGTYELTWFEAERQQGDEDGYQTFSGVASCGGE